MQGPSGPWSIHPTHLAQGQGASGVFCGGGDGVSGGGLLGREGGHGEVEGHGGQGRFLEYTPNTPSSGPGGFRCVDSVVVGGGGRGGEGMMSGRGLHTC
jgi:hypothetical protein